MPIRQLKISGVRNLQPLDLTLQSGVNFIYGDNGSGKTSILEAIVLMAAGKSFRTSQLKHVLAHNADRIEIQMDIDDESLGQCQLDSLRLKGGDHLLKLNGSVLTSQAEAAHWLPVQVIDPTTFKLLSGSPEERRQFIDWGVFHVELWSSGKPSANNLSNATRCLSKKKRNGCRCGTRALSKVRW